MKATLRRLTARLFEYQTRRLLSRSHFKIVGVGGAVGKTATKLAIATVLKQKYRVLVQDGSFNDEIGLPLAVFNLSLPGNIFNPLPWVWRLIQTEIQIHQPYPYQVLVIEIGTDAPGEVPHTLSYLHPHIGVVTAVTPEHMEYFGTMEAVAAEELALVTGSEQSVVNYDDVAAQYRKRYVDASPSHYYYGLEPGVDYGLKVSETSLLDGTSAIFLKDGHVRIGGLELSLYGAHSVKAAAAAYAVGDLLELTTAQLEAGLSAIRPVRGRMNLLAGAHQSHLIDDSYNSSPEAARAALATLAASNVSGRRIAVLGSMNELGSDAARYHEEVGEAVAASKVDLLVTVGDHAKNYLGPAAVRAGFDAKHWRALNSPYEAGGYLRPLLEEGDVVLVKGSQNRGFLEETVRLLLAHPARDTAKLVRQTPFWLRIKTKQFGPRPSLPSKGKS